MLCFLLHYICLAALVTGYFEDLEFTYKTFATILPKIPLYLCASNFECRTFTSSGVLLFTIPENLITSSTTVTFEVETKRGQCTYAKHRQYAQSVVGAWQRLTPKNERMK